MNWKTVCHIFSIGGCASASAGYLLFFYHGFMSPPFKVATNMTLPYIFGFIILGICMIAFSTKFIVPHWERSESDPMYRNPFIERH